MFAVYMALLLCMLVINRILFGLRIMPTDIFSAIWCIFAGTASIGAYGFYTTSFKTNLMIFTTIIVFDVAFTLIYSFNNKAKNKAYLDDVSRTEKKNFFSSVTINNVMMLLLNFVCWAYSFPILRRSVTIIFTEGFEALRRYAFDFDESALTSTNSSLVLVWFVQPVFVATMAIASVSLILKLKGRFLHFALAVLDVAIYTLLFGGRGTIVKMISFFLLTMIVASGKKIFATIARNKWLVLFIVISVAIVVGITVERSFIGYSIMQNFYSYVSGPFIYLQRVLEEHPLSTTDMLWGTATFGCFASAIGAFAKIFFGMEFTAPEYTIPLITANYFDIGENGELNSMTSMIYPFLRDFGYAGLIIGPILYAVLIAVMMRYFEHSKSVRSLSILIYLLHTLAFSVQNLVFIKMEALMIVIFIIMFTTKIKYNDGKLIVS